MLNEDLSWTFTILFLLYIFQNIEKLIDIKEDTEEPGLVVVKVNGEMSREEIVKEILRRTEPQKMADTFKKLNTDSKYCFMQAVKTRLAVNIHAVKCNYHIIYSK